MYETKLRELEGIDERLEVSLNNSVNVSLYNLHSDMLSKFIVFTFLRQEKKAKEDL